MLTNQLQIAANAPLADILMLTNQLQIAANAGIKIS